MNDLLNPFAVVTYPTAVQFSLYAGASIARFDPSGRYVAAGRPDGAATVWDLDTRASIRWLEGHVKGITSVDWSRNSRFLLTASKDWNVIIWDLAALADPPDRRTTIRFDAPVLSASFHPRNRQARIVLVLLGTGEVYIIDLRRHARARSRVELVEDDNAEVEDATGRQSAMTVAQFDPSGKYVFVGTSAGTVLVFHTRTKILVGRHRVPGAGAMKSFDFTRNGRSLVTNSVDRTIRQFMLPASYPSPPSSTFSQTPNPQRSPSPSRNASPQQTDGHDQTPAVNGVNGMHEDGDVTMSQVLENELEPTQRFNDPISRTAWHTMSYSPDGQLLAGGAADPAAHKIFIWDISHDGQFVTALDGGREPLLDVHWHPMKSAIASTAKDGNVLIWHYPTPERWGAFAGGFEEVDENVVYEEREDEFDLEDESALALRKKELEDDHVDIINGDDNLPADGSGLLNGSPCAMGPGEGPEEDYDWADVDNEEDCTPWRMKVLMVDDDDAY
ncbi:WD40 repeat-like protein [Coniophora puteana RWD-64-598 SS2]|uniref:WD40 repeat-like protein n=1 Tax=Coniophora puteana (strain RWD-64-598) TaxID=741705 RepID=A0A5M3MSN5_CONPW|nr:WD40 repeat-like protein [Coniophora puteana RWD-64-598 SS2]EIW82178.1 WD40 repeat-like protein [Coniophora puteana RWD-64-598 SS2]